MPNMTVTFEPTQVTGLTEGSKYFFQNQGGQPVRLAEASAAPVRSSKDGAILQSKSVDRVSEVLFTLGSRQQPLCVDGKRRRECPLVE